ncbi:MAG: hypothetical protein EBX40_06655, partial [Gammaproteobacteria bacterium]|nr:hypothetical protein [Gammaproteobacteria bacterium]
MASQPTIVRTPQHPSSVTDQISYDHTSHFEVSLVTGDFKTAALNTRKMGSPTAGSDFGVYSNRTSAEAGPQIRVIVYAAERGFLASRSGHDVEGMFGKAATHRRMKHMLKEHQGSESPLKKEFAANSEAAVGSVVTYGVSGVKEPQVKVAYRLMAVQAPDFRCKMRCEALGSSAAYDENSAISHLARVYSHILQASFKDMPENIRSVRLFLPLLSVDEYAGPFKEKTYDMSVRALKVALGENRGLAAGIKIELFVPDSQVHLDTVRGHFSQDVSSYSIALATGAETAWLLAEVSDKALRDRLRERVKSYDGGFGSYRHHRKTFSMIDQALVYLESHSDTTYALQIKTLVISLIATVKQLRESELKLKGHAKSILQLIHYLDALSTEPLFGNMQISDTTDRARLRVVREDLKKVIKNAEAAEGKGERAE